MKLDKELKESPPIDTFDNTMLTMYWCCPRKMYWFLRGADYKFVPPYFTFGKAWQEALVTWYLSSEELGKTINEMSPEELFHHGELAKSIARKVWAEDGATGAGVNTLENLELLFNWYMIEYPGEVWKVAEMEIGFVWPVRNTSYFLAGSMDGVISWPSFGDVILENKTTGLSLSDSYLKQFAFSPQISQYIWAYTMTKGREIPGCLINTASKRIPKTKRPDKIFARSLEKRSEFQLEQYEKDTILVIEDIMREWDRWLWPKTRNEIECTGGIGRAPCLFQNLCIGETPKEDINPLSFPEIKDRITPWEPWKRKGVE